MREVHAYISYQRFDYQHVTITGYIRSPLTAKDDIYQESYYSNLLVENRHVLIAVAAVSFAVCLALLVFLLCAAGHKEGVAGIHLNWVDNIPLDLYLVLAVAAGGCFFAAGVDLTNSSIAIAIFVVAVLLVFAVLLVMSVLMTLSTRFKSGAFWKNTIVYRCLVPAFPHGKGSQRRSFLLREASAPVLAGRTDLRRSNPSGISRGRRVRKRKHLRDLVPCKAG